MSTLSGRLHRWAGRVDTWLRLQRQKHMSQSKPFSLTVTCEVRNLIRACVLPDVQVGEGLQIDQTLRQRAQAVLVQVQILQRHEHTHLRRQLGQPVTWQIYTNTHTQTQTLKKIQTASNYNIYTRISFLFIYRLQLQETVTQIKPAIFWISDNHIIITFFFLFYFRKKKVKHFSTLQENFGSIFILCLFYRL